MKVKSRINTVNLPGNRKRFWNIKVTSIPVVFWAFVQESGKETGRTRDSRKNWNHLHHILLSNVDYQNQLGCMKEFWKSMETCCHSDSNKKPSVHAFVINWKRIMIIKKSDTALLKHYIFWSWTISVAMVKILCWNPIHYSNKSKTAQ